MITLNVSELHEVAVIVATVFPVLAVAYYSAARQQLDQLLTDEGPGWTVNMTIPTWTRNRPGRFAIRLFGRAPKHTVQGNKFPMNERFRLQADKPFTFLFSSGFSLTLAYMLFQWRWALGVSIILLQAAIAVLILFTTQNSMVRLAKAIEAKNAHELDTSPMAGLILAVAVNILLILVGVGMAALIEWAPPSH